MKYGRLGMSINVTTINHYNYSKNDFESSIKIISRVFIPYSQSNLKINKIKPIYRYLLSIYNFF